MKIFFPIGAFYPSQQGGPCNALYWHTCALKKNGIDVTIVTTSSGINDKELKKNTFTQKDCGNVYYGNSTSADFKTIQVAFRQIKAADVIHLNSLFSLLSISCFFYTLIFFPKKKLIWSVRGELSDNALKFGKFKKKPLLFLYGLLNKRVYYHSTSHKETIEVKRFFPKTKIFEISNLMKPAIRILNVKKKRQFLFIGRIHPIKALDKLINALHLSTEFKNSKFVLVIAGIYEQRHMSYFDHLNFLIGKFNLQERVKFLGHIRGERKEMLFAESYFTFLPSETENFGNVVLESLNQGTPVLASHGTPWSLLTERKCGFHVNNDPKHLSKTINKIIQLSPYQYENMIYSSHELIDTNFDVEKKISNWIKVYKEISKSNNNKL